MIEAEAAAFFGSPFASAAIQLRHWDDEAKIPGLDVPPATHYLPILRVAANKELTR